MGVYRVEASPNSRAGCQTKPCKDAGVKITKGELRYATQVTIKEHQSWQYRHWGCVTPKQIENLIETCEGDTEMVDGFDELPDEYQEKIKYALENGHVHDDDWKGDVELNRPGQKGIKKRTSKKKGKKGGDDDEEEEAEDAEEAEEKPKKKRASKAKPKAKVEEDAEDAEEAPKPTKKRGRPAKKQVDDGDDDDEEAAAPPAKKATRGRPKKPQYKEESDEDEAPAPKKARGRKAAIKAESPEAEADEEEDAEEEEEAPKPKPKKASKKAAPADGKTKAVPVKRGRKKAAADE
ncbi:hypothetical protein NX059_006437 [Plenodomus lindquistii]|nr:hypothetical protein NX059_006437 [Plenodomus lindquistii]